MKCHHKAWKELARTFADAGMGFKGKGKGKMKGKCRGKGMWPLFHGSDQCMPGMECAHAMPWWAGAWRDWSAPGTGWVPPADAGAADFSQWSSWSSWPGMAGSRFDASAASQDGATDSAHANKGGRGPPAAEVLPEGSPGLGANKESCADYSSSDGHI